MKWPWPFGRNHKDEIPEECECDEDGCEASAEYLESLPACIRNDKDRLRRARKIDRREREAHKLFDFQILQLREIRARLAESKK